MGSRDCLLLPSWGTNDNKDLGETCHLFSDGRVLSIYVEHAVSSSDQQLFQCFFFISCLAKPC